MELVIEDSVIKLADIALHPTEDPAMPSYQHPNYRSMLQTLLFLKDMESGPSVWGDRAIEYLPRYFEEPYDAYNLRLKTSQFTKFFEPATTGYPGLLAGIEQQPGIHPGIVDHWDNIDLQGNDLETFFLTADRAVIRDGLCGIILDMGRPTDGSRIITPQDANTYPLRPYTVLINRLDLINWSDEFTVVRQWRSVKDGLFGLSFYPVYRVYHSSGLCDTYVIAIDNGLIYPVLIQRIQNSIGRSPLIIYSGAAVAPFAADPPLMDLAEMNLDHYRLYSEYRDAMHKVNCATPVRIGLVVPGQNDNDPLPPMILGPNTGVDLPIGGDFRYAEAQGNGLEITRKELDTIEAAMSARSLGFVAGATGGMTVAEVDARSTETRATINTMAIQKESALGQINHLWGLYYGQILEDNGFVINRNFFDKGETNENDQDSAS